MHANQFQVTLPNELMPYIYQLKDGKTTDEKVILSLAIGMFLSKQVTLAKAAEYSGMTLYDFAQLLNNLGVPVVDYTADMLDYDLLFADGMR